MDTPILRIPIKKYGGASTIISMRLPKDLLKDIDTAAAASGRTRNEILTMSLEFALNHMEIPTEKQEEQN